MKFKPVEWEKRGNGFVATVEYGMQLTVREETNGWIWEIRNISSVFDYGESDNERTAKENVECYFHQYLRYLIDDSKCTE